MLKALKIVFLVITQLIGTLLSGIILYLIYAFTGLVFSVGADEPDEGVKLFIRSNGVHTDIVMPVETHYCNWKAFVDTADYTLNKKFEYIAIGWGDKGFFLDTPTWAELSASTAINAIFLPSSCAMHVEYFDHEPATSDLVREMHVTEKGYLELITYIKTSFVLDKGQPLLIKDKSYTGYDQFYEANGKYHLFQTCNSWTNGGLKSAGVKTAAWAVFPGTIMAFRK